MNYIEWIGLIYTQSVIGDHFFAIVKIAVDIDLLLG